MFKPPMVNGLPLKKSLPHWLILTLGLSMVSAVAGCSPNQPLGPQAINSRYADEKPAISGNGRYLAFVSNREGSRNIVLYDLERQQFVDLPYLNRRDAIAETPSISNTARYIVYIASDFGRPEVELYDRVTKTTQVLTRGYRGWVRNPSISPDGRYVAFESGRRGQWDIEVIDRGPTIELDKRDGPSPSSQE